MKIELQNITKRYKDKVALNKVNLTLTNGIYGLLGPNGAGKTTLSHILVGLLQAQDGDVICEDGSLKFLSDEYIKLIGYLPQYPSFYKNFSAEEFLDYMCVLKNIPKLQRKDLIQSLLELVNLTKERKHKIQTFSGGMKQRLGIAQCLVNDPKILILDEPTAGLDPKERIRFRNILSKLSLDRIIIMATHIVSDVEYLANEIILIKSGEVLYKDTPKNLLKILQNKVWLLEISEESLSDFLETYNITNIQHTSTGFQLRIVADENPLSRGIHTEERLEDLYLYLFEEAI